jgi:hypothetical protein
MPPRKHLFAAGTLAATLALAAMFAYALPGPTACLLAGSADLHTLPDGSLTDSASSADHERFGQLTRESRERIASTFGAPEAQPIIVYFNGPDGFGLFKLNATGSVAFLGPRACVMIGPKGQNVDVVAHELMHAELHKRVGYWNRFAKIPTWFDEGVAMQVDYRPRYILSPEDSISKDDVRQLTSFSSFMRGGQKVVVGNYAKARSVVAGWVAKIGRASLYRRLERVRGGESFTEAIE